MIGTGDVDLGNLFRREAGRMTSALTRVFGPQNLPLVEDVVHDALARALEVWKFSGVPENPAAWLTAAAKNRALDVLRREKTARTYEPQLAAALSTEWALVPTLEEAFSEEVIKDEQLRMMFACCHAQLGEEVQVALILHLLSGFGAREIAAAFLASEPAIAKRLQRGKERLAEAGALPPVDEARVAAHLSTVLRALYLLFNEGYHGANRAGSVREELCLEALHLVSLLASSELTARPSTHALFALMCLAGARLPARRDSAGALVALEDQERALWDRSLVQRGLAALEASAEGEEITSYHVEAAIAYEHAVAPSRAETRWDRIVVLYETLMCLTPGPVVALNRAIAVGEAEGPDRGLDELRAIEEATRLDDYPFYAAARGEMLLRAGRAAEARVAFTQAQAKARTPDEERWFEHRLAACVV